MKYDRIFLQCFSCVAIIATIMCVWQENAFGAALCMFITTAMIFIARNIGHLIRCYRYQQRIVTLLRELTKLVLDHNCCNSYSGPIDLNEIIETLDHIHEEMYQHIKNE